jgi:hypothetical protein
VKHTQIFLIAVLLLARLAALPAADSQPSAELRDYAVWSADPNQVLERTCFQTGGAWRNEANLRSDVAIVYVVGTSLPARIHTWRDRGYRIHVMTGV